LEWRVQHQQQEFGGFFVVPIECGHGHDLTAFVQIRRCGEMLFDRLIPEHPRQTFHQLGYFTLVPGIARLEVPERPVVRAHGTP